ncbi:MAG: cytochrome c biogenesis protein [Bacteroidota bacterium]
MKNAWWKLLGVVLIIYSFVAGMLVPLKTGIETATPQSARTGETVDLQVKGYNAHYMDAGSSLRAWLKMDSTTAIAAKQITPTGDNQVVVTFDMPTYLPTARKVQDFALILDSEIDGASVLPQALFVTQDTVNEARGVDMFRNSDISGLHQLEGITFPYRNILYETIRNTYFHVPLWFGMLFIFIAAMVFSIRYLRKGNPIDDIKAAALTQVGLMYGVLGLVTGAIWANWTWGEPWSGDVKQNMTAIALLVYFAYFILRGSFDDDQKRARISAVYNIFAFAALIPLIYVVPRLTASLHPGAGGNPAFGSDDLDNTMRMVFYPAIIGWTLFGAWIAQLSGRMDIVKHRFLER